MGDDHIPAMEQCAKDALRLAEKTGDQNILSRSLTTLGIVHETRGGSQKQSSSSRSRAI